ncbi:MAG: glycoside hydrolase family 2 TIM barrel-domain containing protein [Fimbriimonas sp.]|nr:glycoside hydrolase family 2 TIM barrel-domain containing protein [Fimbriimonas sp.]
MARLLLGLLSVLALLAGIPLSASQEPVNLALRAVRTSASSWRPEFPPTDAIDNDFKTSFSVALGARKDQWYRLDWDRPERIAGIALWQPDRYTESFDIDLMAGGKWQTVRHMGAPIAKLGRNVFATFVPTMATALRLNHLDSTEVGGSAFYEIGVYGDSEAVTKMENRVDVAIAGDATGRLIGTASFDGGSSPLAGAHVEVDGANPAGVWSVAATTNEHGFFYVDLPLNPVGPIHAKVTLEPKEGETTVDASDIATRLTPRPTVNNLVLDGQWDFMPDPPENVVADAPQMPWKPIKVPSNYEMEGYRAKTDRAAYRKSLIVPLSWTGKLIRLRAEAIYSKAEIWLNGVRLGSHEGGATPFEIDLTKAVRPGKANELIILVAARSKSAVIDHMSTYAYFEVAGIWRPIGMFCVEPSHISRLTYAVVFDPSYQDAILSLDVKLANERATPSSGRLTVTILDPSGKKVAATGLEESVIVEPWHAKTVRLSANFAKPLQWNAELPRSYRILAHWTANDQPGATVEQPLGFRQVEIKGRAFSINGKPVRLFGTCLHSSDPLLGRAITPERARQDLELIKEANFNAIRTTHYPPYPTTPALADEMGIYIEDEGPSCWGDENEDLRNAPMYVGIVSEYVERDRNHPSVVYWSTCNESNYGIIFQLAHRYVKMLDPTRPVGGSYAPMDMDTDVYVLHYPQTTYKFFDEAKNYPKVTLIDECVGIPHGWGNLAFSQEIDPGMHCLWEWKMPEIRRSVMETENQMGTMSWAWVDDAFAIPGRGITNSRMEMPQIRYADSIYKMPGRGYQGDTVWGMVDGWRRPRPEWWQCKKVYSPVIVEEKPLPIPAKGEPISVAVENMNWFANLSIYRCQWHIGKRTGFVVPDVPASSKGNVEIPYPFEVKASDTLTLKWLDEMGRLVDAYRLEFHPHEAPKWEPAGSADVSVEEGRYLSSANTVYLRARDSEIALDKTSGELRWGLRANEVILQRGPTLHILKSTDPTATLPAGWKFSSETHGPGVIHWNGAFGTDFLGGYTLKMDGLGHIEAEYSFTYNGPEMYVRELGLELELPLAFDRLTWDRRAEHSYYPDDHMDRATGTVLAHPRVLQITPPTNRPFELDDHPWGCNDFRSTKRNVYWASVTNSAGQGVRVISDGTQHIRATIGVHGVSLKVLDFYGGLGGPKDWAVEGFHYGAGRLIKTGEVVSGRVRLVML